MENQTIKWILGGIAALIILLILCTCCVGSIAIAGYFAQNIETPEVTYPTDEWEPENPPTPIVEPLSDEALQTLAALEEAVIPDADLHELGIRFLGVPSDTPRVASTTNPDYSVGTRHKFNVSNVDTDEQFEIYAVLEYKTDHVYMWVEEDVPFNESALEEAAELFEKHTYPTDREFFGSEAKPGIDGDPHLSILHARNLGGTVAGYFSSPDQYVRAVRSDSNEMEMFYINIDNVVIGDEFYNGVLAHEFQHMIHWNNDRNEDTWLNEGCSELAMALNDRAYGAGAYDVGGSDSSYMYAPDTQLNTWPEGVAGDASANYGGAYLFMEYFLGRFGEDATKNLVNHPENSMESVDTVLQELGESITHKELFADWSIANLLDDTSVDGARYGYEDIDPYNPNIGQSYFINDLPIEKTATVQQYGVDYIEVEGESPLRFSFTGSTQVKLMDTDAHSGEYLLWSNRADESDSRLTRIVDLSDADEATLNFWMWYHIEEDWDYAYIMAGTTDDGTLPDDLSDPKITWDILDDASTGCTSSNPNGNNYGCGVTGQSNDWEEVSIDLSAYAGKEIALRFEYITDAAVNQPGLAIDDLEIIADGSTLIEDDMEEEDPAWITEGFVRHANVLPQEWLVQLVTFGNDTEVEPLIIADGTEGEWTLPLSANTDRAVIVISALAPVTTESAPYTYVLSEE